MLFLSRGAPALWPLLPAHLLVDLQNSDDRVEKCMLGWCLFQDVSECCIFFFFSHSEKVTDELSVENDPEFDLLP